MKIEPNADIGMRAETVLCHANTVEFTHNEKMNGSELKKSGNAFETLCNSIDPNVTYINVIVPEHQDDTLYFELRDFGKKIGIHVQSVKQTPEEAWQTWEYYKQVSDQTSEQEA
ncbi:hypothetical protein ACFL4L_07535 [bacterium]